MKFFSGLDVEGGIARVYVAHAVGAVFPGNVRVGQNLLAKRRPPGGQRESRTPTLPSYPGVERVGPGTQVFAIGEDESHAQHPHLGLHAGIPKPFLRA